MTKAETILTDVASPTFTAAQVCEVTGATPKQLRYWDEHGVLVPARTGEGVSNNRKIYSESEVQQVRDILLFKELGFELKEISKLLRASEAERIQAMKAASANLELTMKQIQQRSLLASLCAVQGVEATNRLARFFACTGDFAETLMKDENLRQVVRWTRSHSEEDALLLVKELQGASEEFEKLRQQDGRNQDDVERALVHFCDLWSKRFGWPTVGEMLMLSVAFGTEEPDSLRLALAPLVDEETLDFMAFAFMLGWLMATLATIDESLVHLYIRLLREEGSASFSVKEFAEVMEAIVFECGGFVCLCDAPPSEERTRVALDLAEQVFDLLEGCALDHEVEEYLNIDEYPAIDGSSLGFALDCLCAYERGELESWLSEEGRNALVAPLQEWAEYLEEPWVAERYPDFPEARWATEEEHIAVELRSLKHLGLKW